MNLDLLVEDLDGSEIARDRRLLDKLHTVQTECQHLEEILDAFLQFARVGTLELISTDLNQLVTRFLDFYRPQADEIKVEISPHLEPDLPPVDVDEPLLRQALMNLFRNSAQAMPDGGRIEVQTKARDNEVELVVIDNGSGMDDVARSKMYDTFFSTRPGGSGLGLPTVRKIIQAHQGRIDCESEPDRGTRFVISLPASRETLS